MIFSDREALSCYSDNAIDTFISIRNNGGGAANLYLDAQNGDLAGSDYVSIGQLDAGDLRFSLGTNAPSWSMQFRDSSVTHVSINRTNPKLEVFGEASIGASATSGVLHFASANASVTYDNTLGWFYLTSGKSLYLQGGGNIGNIGGTGTIMGFNYTGNGYVDVNNYVRGTYLLSEGNIYVNYDGPDGPSYLYFYNNSSTIGEYLGWDDTSGQFLLSDTLRVNGHLSIIDGVSAPSTLGGWAQIYADSSDGDLKVKFGDGYTATLAADSSDLKFKTNIQHLAPVLDEIKKLNPVTFDWTGSAANHAKKIKGDRNIGLIAQEVAEVYPEVVYEVDDTTLAVDYPKLTAVLIKAVQELTAKVEALESKSL